MKPRKSVCAWCTKVLREGEEPISHDICPACYAKVKEHVERLKCGEHEEDSIVLAQTERCEFSDLNRDERCHIISLSNCQLERGLALDLKIVITILAMWLFGILAWFTL